MGFLRTLCGLVAASAGIFYLTSASSLSDNGSWTLIGISFGATFAWVLLGGRGVKQGARIASAQTIDTVAEPAMVETEEEAADIPPPVTSDENLDGVSLRERKMAKIKSANQQENDPDEEVEELVTVGVTLENVHTADEYVVDVSPESVEDADIEMTVSNRRVKHQEIRQRNEKRRKDGAQASYPRPRKRTTSRRKRTQRRPNKASAKSKRRSIRGTVLGVRQGPRNVKCSRSSILLILLTKT